MIPPVDATASYLLFLYLILLESILFAAVIIHMKAGESSINPWMAYLWAAIYILIATSQLFYLLSTQLYTGAIPSFSTVAAHVALWTYALAIILCVPAATWLVFPDRAHPGVRLGLNAVLGIVLVACTLIIPMHSKALPPYPHLAAVTRQHLVSATIGAVLAVSIAAGIRYIRKLKASSGALLLYVSGAATIALLILWMRWEPMCRVVLNGMNGNFRWNQKCPFGEGFDENAVVAAVTALAHLTAAEGVLRMIAVGNGLEGYVTIG